ncbi:MAG: hypothetical protein ACYC3I_01230 [Gemmataceae bacterium]
MHLPAVENVGSAAPANAVTAGADACNADCTVLVHKAAPTRSLVSPSTRKAASSCMPRRANRRRNRPRPRSSRLLTAATEQPNALHRLIARPSFQAT